MAADKTGEREHFWDALRAFLMLLGIPYHTALAYRPEREWIVHSGEGATVFTYLAEFIHLFRMPAFFIIAGYFAARLLVKRSPGSWLHGRFRRLTIPFIACIATLVPILNFACEMSNLPLADALASWRHNSATSGGYWVRHLWFIIVLLYCSTIMALFTWAWPALSSARLPARIDGWIARHHLTALLCLSAVLGLWQAIAIELFYKAGLARNVPQEILRLDEFIAFAPYFLIGCMIARAPQTLDRLVRFLPSVALVAAGAVTLSLVLLDDLSPPVGRFVATFAAVATTQTIIAAARHLASQPIPLVQNLVAASFVIYLFHMPIIVVLVELGQNVPLPVVAKVIAVMLLSLLLSYGAWHAISRSSVLSFLFNGDKLPFRPSGRLA